ncbi:MAG: type II secretion system minor pseudopilin GspH [Sedimenticola sp.]
MITRQNGFTLIELLVVVFIIGIISGVAVLSVGGVNGGRRLETEGQRMGYLFSLATQESILQGRPVGVTLNDAGYGFVIAGVEEWGELEGEPLLAARTLPDDWQLELVSGGYQKPSASEVDVEEEKGEGVIPQIIFFPSGQISPFILRLSDLSTDTNYHLEGLATGQIKRQVEASNR